MKELSNAWQYVSAILAISQLVRITKRYELVMPMGLEERIELNKVTGMVTSLFPQ